MPKSLKKCISEVFKKKTKPISKHIIHIEEEEEEVDERMNFLKKKYNL